MTTIEELIKQTYSSQGLAATTTAVRQLGIEMRPETIRHMARKNGWKRRREVTCGICETMFVTNHPMARLCGKACRQEYRRRQHAEYFQRRRAGLPTSQRRVRGETNEDPRVVAALKARDLGDASLIEQLLADQVSVA